MDLDAVSNDTPLGNDFTHDPPGNGVPMDSPSPNGFPMDLLTGACSSFDSLRRSVYPDGLFNDTLPGNDSTLLSNKLKAFFNL
jgi:hypothetical protein